MRNSYQGPGQLYSTRDSEQRNPFTEKLAEFVQNRQDQQSQGNLAAMAAERMRGLGPQGEQWAAMIQRDPRAALAMMEQYGGPEQIEASILGARAQGEAQERWGQALQGSEMKPEEYQIMLQGGPDKGPAALKAYRDSMGGGSGPASYTTDEGVFVRDPNAPGGYRNAGMPNTRGPLVQIGNDGLTKVQEYNLEEGMRDDYEKKSEPFVRISSSIANFDELIADSEQDPSALSSQRATYAFQRALDDAAVMEGDVKRILGTNYWNVVRGWVNAPQTATRDQLIEMRDLLSQAKRVEEIRQRRIDEQFTKLVKSRNLNMDAVVQGGGYSAQQPRAAQRQALPTMDDLMSMSPGETFVDADGITVRKTDRVDANGEPIFEDVD